MTREAKVPLRVKLQLAGTVLCLGFYWVRSSPPPKSIAVGVERRLFAGSGYTLLPEPGGAGWLVGVPAPPASGGGILESFLQRLEWPGGYQQPRRLTPFREGGTWILRPLGIRRVWRFQAVEAWNERYLWAGRPFSASLYGDALPEAFDYRARQELSGAEAVRLLQSRPTPADPWETESDEPFTAGSIDLNDEAAGIEGIDTELYYSLSAKIGERTVRLWWGQEAPVLRGLYAVSSDATPRVLRLTANAEPKALSPDGKTLFFERDRALWRLDLRRPLTELLDESAPPPLPDPPR